VVNEQYRPPDSPANLDLYTDIRIDEPEIAQTDNLQYSALWFLWMDRNVPGHTARSNSLGPGA